MPLALNIKSQYPWHFTFSHNAPGTLHWVTLTLTLKTVSQYPDTLHWITIPMTLYNESQYLWHFTLSLNTLTLYTESQYLVTLHWIPIPLTLYTMSQCPDNLELITIPLTLYIEPQYPLTLYDESQYPWYFKVTYNTINTLHWHLHTWGPIYLKMYIE